MSSNAESSSPAFPEAHSEAHPEAFPPPRASAPGPEQMPASSYDGTSKQNDGTSKQNDGTSKQNDGTRGGVGPPIAAYVEAAKQLLLLQQSASNDTARERATAAGRAYDALFESLAPVIGEAGIHALFARSLKLAQRAAPCLAEVRVNAHAQTEGVQFAPQLIGCLSKLEPAAATQAATDLFATFFGLMSNFIGDELVRQIVKNAFPPDTTDQGRL